MAPVNCCPGSGANLHVIERFRRVDADTIDYQYTVDDPTTYTKPWTVSIPMSKSTEPIYEYACHEGNYGMKNLLSGARAMEKAAAEAKKQNVNIRAILASADDFDYGNARYDLIYATFEHQIVTDNAAKIVAALKPDGMVVIEGFQEDMSKQIGRPLGHRVNELTRAFDQLRILYYEDTVGPADWNDGKPAPIVRFIAPK